MREMMRMLLGERGTRPIRMKSLHVSDFLSCLCFVCYPQASRSTAANPMDPLLSSLLGQVDRGSLRMVPSSTGHSLLSADNNAATDIGALLRA